VTSSPHLLVTHVLWEGQVGGIERLVHDLAAEQSRLGMDVGVAFGQPKGFFVEEIGRLGIRIIDLGLRSGYDLWPAKLSRASELLGESDVLHAHGFNLPLSIAMRRSHRPIVFTEHGQFGLGRRLGLTGSVKQRAQRRFVTSDCAAVAANSRWTATRLSETYGIGTDRVTVVYNGIAPATRVVPAESHRDGNRTVVLFAGRLKQFKRVDRIIRAVARIPERDRVRVLIAGGGPLENELRALARELKVESEVQFLGWRPEIQEVLVQADVLVLPSEGEPFGLALVEGCAAGLLPVAFADGGGALECISPDGRVVSDVDQLAEVLRGLDDSDALSPTARARRSAWAQEQFPISETARRYTELYRSATAGNLRPPR
jgi:glycosyltransferase involved in cell wall biosynthesis